MPQFNAPSLWLSHFPVPKPDGHKYTRGCAVVFGGEKMTGAARLAASAAMRIGAGLCVVVAPEQSANIYRSALPAHIIVEDFETPSAHLSDERSTAVLVGPGLGANKDLVLAVLATKKPCVLDADALTIFEHDREVLLAALHENCVLTPHEGEFTRLFPDITGSKLMRAEKAAAMTGAIILLKGNDTIIACAGQNETLVQDQSSPYLATAGSGDVLAGFITGLLAQGMKPFEAAAAGVYVHSAAAKWFGAGLVATDLPDLIPIVLKDLGL